MIIGKQETISYDITKVVKKEKTENKFFFIIHTNIHIVRPSFYTKNDNGYIINIVVLRHETFSLMDNY